MAGRITFNIDERSLQRNFAEQYWTKTGAIGRSKGMILSALRKAQRTNVEFAKENPVIQELKAGENSSNISSTISYEKTSSKENNANLFNFIGFPQGYDPTKDLLDLLARPIPITLTKTISDRNEFVHEFEVDTITKSEAYAVTPMPGWAGDKSWAEAIETGALLNDTIGYLLTISTSKSRSGTAVQAKLKNKRGSSFSENKFLSEILEDFRSKLQYFVDNSAVLI